MPFYDFNKMLESALNEYAESGWKKSKLQIVCRLKGLNKQLHKAFLTPASSSPGQSGSHYDRPAWYNLPFYNAPA